MIRPSLLTAVLLGGGAPVILILALTEPAAGYLGVWYFLAVMGLGVFDAWQAPRARELEVEVEAPSRLMVGEKGKLAVTMIAPPGRRLGRLEVAADIGGVLRPHSPGRPYTAFGRMWLDLDPLKRGVGDVEAIRLRWYGPLRLTYRQIERKLDLKIPVVPNIRAAEREALKFDSRERAGLKPQHQQGEGTEFEALREYTQGLDPRSIDWKHSARHRQVLCKQFEIEQNHQIVLAFDTGHLMGEIVDGIPKLDHAINAGLALTYRSLRGGDKVGFMSFDAKVQQYFAPAGGMKTMPVIRGRLAKLEYSTDETNFMLGLTTLLSQLRRRSLVVLLTDFVDTITAEIMAENVRRLARRHIVVFATFRDKLLYRLKHNAAGRYDDIVKSVVASEFVDERRRLFLSLRRIGVQCIEPPTEELAGQLLSKYLLIKRKALI